MSLLHRKLLFSCQKSALKLAFSSFSRPLSNAWFQKESTKSLLKSESKGLAKQTRNYTKDSEEQRLLSLYEPVIGLEVHAQLNLKTKLFSNAVNKYAARANSQVSPFDLSLPGSLPSLNRKAVLDAILTGLALNCQIPYRSTFDRKHYFYGDLPNGYQITQQREPIAYSGFIDFIVYDEFHHMLNVTKKDFDFAPYMKRCHLKQIQLEQDSGKSLIDTEDSLIDLNRAGVALLEFVFEPELHSTLEATCLVQELIQILQILGTCTGKLEEGALRVDANISVRKKSLEAFEEGERIEVIGEEDSKNQESNRIKNPGAEDKDSGIRTRIDWKSLGTRTEVKNLNSFRFIRDAVQYEQLRQIRALESGVRIDQETLAWDMKSKQTLPMRDKEIVQDYRFMPEPNLPPIFVLGGSGTPSATDAGSGKTISTLGANGRLESADNGANRKGREKSIDSMDSEMDSEDSFISRPIELSLIQSQLSQYPLPARIRSELESYSLTLVEKKFLQQNPELLELFKEIHTELYEKTAKKPEVGVFIFDYIYRLISGLHDTTLLPVTIQEIRERILVKNLTEILRLIDCGKISVSTSLELIRIYQQGIRNDEEYSGSDEKHSGLNRKNPEEIVDEFNWSLVEDPQEIERICRQVAKDLPKVAKAFAKKGVRKPRSMLIQNAQLALDNRVDEETLWQVFERILLDKR